MPAPAVGRTAGPRERLLSNLKLTWDSPGSHPHRAIICSRLPHIPTPRWTVPFRVNRLLPAVTILGIAGVLSSARWERNYATAVTHGEAAAHQYDLAMACILARHALKSELADQLVTGRLSLGEAAVRLNDHLKKESPLPGVNLSFQTMASLPGQSEEERCARHLVSWVTRRFGEESQYAPALVRMEQQVRVEYGADSVDGEHRPAE